MTPRSNSFQPFARLRDCLRRATLDRRLAEGADPAAAPELSRRAQQLTSERTRRQLAAWIESLIEAAEKTERGLRPAVPLQREAIRETRPLLLSLARDLAQVDEPASARGIARIRQLLTDGGSPLYACPCRVCAGEGTSLDQAIRHARTTLALS